MIRYEQRAIQALMAGASNDEILKEMEAEREGFFESGYRVGRLMEHLDSLCDLIRFHEIDEAVEAIAKEVSYAEAYLREVRFDLEKERESEGK